MPIMWWTVGRITTGSSADKQEKGILSNSKKRIFYTSFDLENNPRDCVNVKRLCDFLKDKNVYYKYEGEDCIHENWKEYILEKCKKIPTPKELGYHLDTNDYGNVDAVDIMPDGWHKTSLTVTQIKKEKIPYYKACVGFQESGYRHVKPILVNIIPDDFSQKEKEYFEKLSQKANNESEKLKAIELTQDVISDCLYSINKEAKRKRDIQKNCIDRAYGELRYERYPGVHYNLHKAKDEKAALYDLKEQALAVAIQLWDLKPEGYHEFPDMCRDMYSFAGHDFHVNECESDKCLGKIDTEIDADRKRSIPPKKAIALLKRFVCENQSNIQK